MSQASGIPHIANPRISNALKSVLWMAASTFLFIATDSAIKAVGKNIHPFEVGFFRNLFGLAIMLPFLSRKRFEALKTDRLRLIVVRGVLGAIATWTFFLGITLSPLAEAITLSFMAPLFGLVLAVLMLGERASSVRVLALLFGLGGALVVIQPTATGVNYASILLLLAAVSNGLIFIVVKILTRTESSLTITAWMTISVGVLTLPPALTVWSLPTPRDYVLLLAIGGLASLAQYTMAQSLRYGEAGLLMPVDFLKLVWATAFGFWIFGEIPSFHIYVGAALIIAANLASAIYETRRTHKARALVQEA